MTIIAVDTCLLLSETNIKISKYSKEYCVHYKITCDSAIDNCNIVIKSISTTRDRINNSVNH